MLPRSNPLLLITALFACVGQSYDRNLRRPSPHQPGWPPRDGCPGAGGSDAGVQIELCTGSTYASSASCPSDGPVAGAGTCGNFTVKANVCYTFSDFSDVPKKLKGNTNYIHIPNSTEITTCGLYKTTNCTIAADLEWDECETGSTDLVCRKHLSGDILSWNCTTG